MAAGRVLIVNGSPRKKGNSVTLAERVAEGARAVGAEVESVLLHDLDIKPCDACDVCLKDSERDCHIDDGMKGLYPLLRRTDALVIAGPVYWFTVSAQTKLFMDRCYALQGPGGNALRGKRIGIVLTYADSDAVNSGAVNAIRTFQDAYRYIGCPIVGMVYGSADAPGEVRDNSDLMDRAYNLGRLLIAEG